MKTKKKLPIKWYLKFLSKKKVLKLNRTIKNKSRWSRFTTLLVKSILVPLFNKRPRQLRHTKNEPKKQTGLLLVSVSDPLTLTAILKCFMLNLLGTSNAMFVHWTTRSCFIVHISPELKFYLHFYLARNNLAKWTYCFRCQLHLEITTFRIGSCSRDFVQIWT